MHSCLSMNLFATFAFLLPGHPTLSTTFDYLKQRKKTAEKIDTNAQWFDCSWSILLKRVNIRVRGFHLVYFHPSSGWVETTNWIWVHSFHTAVLTTSINPHNIPVKLCIFFHIPSSLLPSQKSFPQLNTPVFDSYIWTSFFSLSN